MNKLQLIKIALLIVILAEEIRSAIANRKYNYDSFNGRWERKGKASMLA